MSADLNLTVKKTAVQFLNEEISFNKWAVYFVEIKMKQI